MVLLSMGVWMAIGLGVGFLLHGLVPAIDVGMATFIGVVTLGGCLLWLSRMSTRKPSTDLTTSNVPDTTWSTTPQAAWRAARRKRRRRHRHPYGLMMDTGCRLMGYPHRCSPHVI